MESRRYQAEASSFLSTCPVQLHRQCSILPAPTCDSTCEVLPVRHTTRAQSRGHAEACITDLNSSVSSPRHPAGTEWPKGFITQSHSCQAGNSEELRLHFSATGQGPFLKSIEYMKFGHLSPAALTFPETCLFMSSLMITSIFTMWVVFPQLGWRSVVITARGLQSSMY